MKINQINISRNEYKNTLGQLNNENNQIQGGNFSFCDNKDARNEGKTP